MIMATASGIRTMERNVVVLGKTGGGKSTVANKILETSPTQKQPFVVSDRKVTDSATARANAAITYLKTTDGCQYYIKVIDTVGLFDTKGKTNKEILDATKQYIRDQIPDGVNLVLFIYRQGRWTKEEQDTFDFITKNFRNEISSISALVITGCDGYDKPQKEDVIKDFTESKPKIAGFMEKGIHPVGFPDLTKLKPKLKALYEEDARNDQEELRRLIYSCDDKKLSREIMGETIWERASKCIIL